MENNTFISLDNLSEFKTLMDQDIDKKLHEYTIFTGSGTTLAEAFRSQAYQIYLALQESDKVALDYTCTSYAKDAWKTSVYYYTRVQSGNYYTFTSKETTHYYDNGGGGDGLGSLGIRIKPSVNFYLTKYSDRDDAYISSESFNYGVGSTLNALSTAYKAEDYDMEYYIPFSSINPVTLSILRNYDAFKYIGQVESVEDLPKIQQLNKTEVTGNYLDIDSPIINTSSSYPFYTNEFGSARGRGKINYKYFFAASAYSPEITNDALSLFSNNAAFIAGFSARKDGNDYRMALKINASEEYPVFIYCQSNVYFGGVSQIHYIDDDTDEFVNWNTDHSKTITRPFYIGFKNSTTYYDRLRTGTNINVISAGTAPNLIENSDGSSTVFFESTENINAYKIGSYYYEIGDTILASRLCYYTVAYTYQHQRRFLFPGAAMTVGPKKDLYMLDAAYNWKKVADTPEPTAKGIMTEGCVLYNVTANGYNGLKDWLNQRKEEVISAINNGNPFTIFFNDTNLNGENKTGTYIQRYYKRYNSNWDYYYIILYGSNISFSDTSSSHTYSNITISNNTLMITLKKNPETQEYTDIDVSYVATPGDNYKILNYLSPTSQNDNSYFTPTYKSQPVSKGYLDTVIQGINQFKREIVQELPTQDIDVNTIYMVPKTTTGTNNAYDEYLYINQSWEKIGDTEIDLSNYLAKDNTTTYAPIADYNPATKKYIDDSLLDKLTYKGHVNSVEDLPIISQESATPTELNLTIDSALDILDYTNKTNRLTSFLSYINPSKKFFIGTTYSRPSYNNVFCGIITDYPECIDGISISSKFQSSTRLYTYFAVHVSYDADKPVYYKVNREGVSFVPDSTGQEIAKFQVDVLNLVDESGWIPLGMYNVSHPAETLIYSNLDYIKFKHFDGTSIGFAGQGATVDKKFTSITNNNYTFVDESLFIKFKDNLGYWVTTDPLVPENSIYTVGENNDIYRCNAQPAWELWAAFENKDMPYISTDTKILDLNEGAYLVGPNVTLQLGFSDEIFKNYGSKAFLQVLDSTDCKRFTIIATGYRYATRYYGSQSSIASCIFHGASYDGGFLSDATAFFLGDSYPTKSGTESIYGTWTFTNSPTITNAPTQDNQAATKKYVDDKVGIPCVRLTENTDLRTSTLLPIGDYYLIKGSYTLTYSYSDIGDNDHVYTFTNIPNDGCLFHVGSKNDFSIDELVASWEDLDTGTKYAVIKDGRGEPTLYSSTMVDIENEQTITGLKHFNTLPQSTVTPTTNYQLANKKYVDDSKGTILSNIAPTYDNTQTYNEGDYVIYDSQLYVCNTDIQTAESWTAAHWTQTTLAELLGNIKTLLGAI